MTRTKLSPAMEKAIKNADADGTICGADVRTELALIRRGLAVAVYGDEERTNRYSWVKQTAYNVYLGARLVKGETR